MWEMHFIVEGLQGAFYFVLEKQHTCFKEQWKPHTMGWNWCTLGVDVFRDVTLEEEEDDDGDDDVGGDVEFRQTCWATTDATGTTAEGCRLSTARIYCTSGNWCTLLVCSTFFGALPQELQTHVTVICWFSTASFCSRLQFLAWVDFFF